MITTAQIHSSMSSESKQRRNTSSLILTPSKWVLGVLISMSPYFHVSSGSGTTSTDLSILSCSLNSYSLPSFMFTLSTMIQAANIPLVCELGIDKLSFDDFSLDVDAMITAALRMFMELGMLQKFKIDYEVRSLTVFVCLLWILDWMYPEHKS